MYDKLFQKALFPIMERLSGTEIQHRLRELEKSQWFTRAEIEQNQEQKLRALIQHAYENVPYYHRIFRERGIQPEDIRTKGDLEKIPLLTKDIIRNHFNELVAVNIPKSHRIVLHSSGSTGEPMKYYIDKATYSAGWAQTFRCWGWAGYSLGEPYVKISLNQRKTIYKKFQDRLMNTRYIYASGITEENISQIISEIQQFNPKIIRGYASYMYLLAKNMEKNGITYSGSALATTGDILYPKYRKSLVQQFNCKVFDGYGGEGTTAAFECESHEGLHICEEDVLVEFLSNNEKAAPGELANIVFTNLNNYAMPFIRYDIRDLGIYTDEVCSCGRELALMKSIEGRDADIVITPKGDYLVLQFFKILFEYFEGVDQFQVVQESLNELRVKIIRNEKFRETDLTQIHDQIQERMGSTAKIRIEFVDDIPVYGRSGKRRFVISNVPLHI